MIIVPPQERRRRRRHRESIPDLLEGEMCWNGISNRHSEQREIGKRVQCPRAASWRLERHLRHRSNPHSVASCPCWNGISIPHRSMTDRNGTDELLHFRWWEPWKRFHRKSILGRGWGCWRKWICIHRSVEHDSGELFASGKIIINTW